MANFHIKKAMVEEGLNINPMSRRILARVPHESYENPSEENPSGHMGKDTLHLLAYKGEFLKPCPGTKEYICCGYQILNVATNCPLDCSYCILQSYFHHQPRLRIHVNLEEKLAAILAVIDQDPKQMVRVGTGEFADSLALDPLTRWTEILMPPFPSEKTLFWNSKPKPTT